MKTADLSNRKGQIASTLTWAVATIIIIVIISIFLYATSLLSGVKKLSSLTAGDPILDPKTSDLLAMKSFSAYLHSPINGENVYQTIQAQGNVDSSEAEFGRKVFSFLYPRDLFIFVFDVPRKRVIPNDSFSKLSYFITTRYWGDVGGPATAFDVPLFSIFYYLAQDKDKSLLIALNPHDVSKTNS
jgi:hypothetical protein